MLRIYGSPLCRDCVLCREALDAAGVPLGAAGNVFRKLPLYDMGFGWVTVALAALAAGLALGLVSKEKVSR